MTIRKINILSGPYDQGRFDLEERSYQVAPNYGVFIGKDGIWLVRGTWDTPDTLKQASGSILLGDPEGDDAVTIQKITDKLTGISGLEFMFRFLVDGDYDIQFSILHDDYYERSF